MGWMLTPLGISIIVIVILVLTTLIYWKRKPIKGWLSNRKVVPTLKLGPVELELEEKDRAKETPSEPSGVDFGEENDFTGASIRGVAGRDIRRGASASAPPSGQTPSGQTPSGQTLGVDFGKRTQFRDAEIEDIAGRDIVED
jgi:hypothetical protein